ncbi:MAG TPA: hypothetical protein VFY45_04230 [Baekduia sp.]|nr:hypothetical protein [Baekduia sp.]
MTARAAKLRSRLPSADQVLGRPGRVAVLCAVALVIVGSLGAPDNAQAIGLPGLPSLNPADWAVDAFKAILKFIFGDQLEELARHLVNLLLAVPLLTDTSKFPQLNKYRDYVTGGAWGILGLSFVVSSMRYWLSSYSGAGAYEALMGFARTVGSVAMLLVFPIAFDQLSRAVNEFTAALAVNPIVGQNLGKGLVGTLTGALGTGGGIGMLVGIAAIVMAIVLLVIKVIVTTLLAVLFVLSPLAIALWPIEELSWALRTLLQAMLGLLVFPILWAVCFGTFAVLSVDALFPANLGDLINSVLSPLVTLAALIIAFRLPFVVLRQAMNSGIGPSLMQINQAGQSAHFARTAASRAVR